MESFFLMEYGNLSGRISDPTELAAAQAAVVQKWLAARPKEMFADLRRREPIFKSPRAVIVTRYPDVLEVLHQDSVFSIDLYTPRMVRVHDRFFLGMADTEQYQREVSIMRLVVDRADIPRIRSFVTETADALVEAVRSTGTIDLIGDLSRVVPTRLVADYLGVAGPSEEVTRRWLRALFWDLFANLSNDKDVVRAADEAAGQLKDHLAGAIEARKSALASGGEVPDDVLTRLVRLQSAAGLSLDDDGIRRNLTGVSIGAVETTSKCVANVLDVLLDRPAELKAAQEAALREDDGLDAYVYEALRFSPQHAFLYRICVKDYTIARGTERETMIPKGSFVVAAVLSAMFDEDWVRNPEQFVPGRPADNYLLFGAGLHECFGIHINRVQIPAICRSVLRLAGLRRKPGPDGLLQMVGPFPDRCILEFDAY